MTTWGQAYDTMMEATICSGIVIHIETGTMFLKTNLAAIRTVSAAIRIPAVRGMSFGGAVPGSIVMMVMISFGQVRQLF
jgi:hypothetical protein